jgi:hypothetical protein
MAIMLAQFLRKYVTFPRRRAGRRKPDDCFRRLNGLTIERDVGGIVLEQHSGQFNDDQNQEDYLTRRLFAVAKTDTLRAPEGEK